MKKIAKNPRRSQHADAKRFARVNVWNPDGDSWTDEHGNFSGDICTLTVTGSWSSGGGWFQPNEVSHWMPLPEPPK